MAGIIQQSFNINQAFEKAGGGMLGAIGKGMADTNAQIAEEEKTKAANAFQERLLGIQHKNAKDLQEASLAQSDKHHKDSFGLQQAQFAQGAYNSEETLKIQKAQLEQTKKQQQDQLKYQQDQLKLQEEQLKATKAHNAATLSADIQAKIITAETKLAEIIQKDGEPLDYKNVATDNKTGRPVIFTANGPVYVDERLNPEEMGKFTAIRDGIAKLYGQNAVDALAPPVPMSGSTTLPKAGGQTPQDQTLKVPSSSEELAVNGALGGNPTLEVTSEVTPEGTPDVIPTDTATSEVSGQTPIPTLPPTPTPAPKTDFNTTDLYGKLPATPAPAPERLPVPSVENATATDYFRGTMDPNLPAQGQVPALTPEVNQKLDEQMTPTAMASRATGVNGTTQATTVPDQAVTQGSVQQTGLIGNGTNEKFTFNNAPSSTDTEQNTMSRLRNNLYLDNGVVYSMKKNGERVPTKMTPDAFLNLQQTDDTGKYDVIGDKVYRTANGKIVEIEGLTAEDVRFNTGMDTLTTEAKRKNIDAVQAFMDSTVFASVKHGSDLEAWMENETGMFWGETNVDRHITAVGKWADWADSQGMNAAEKYRRIKDFANEWTNTGPDFWLMDRGLWSFTKDQEERLYSEAGVFDKYTDDVKAEAKRNKSKNAKPEVKKGPKINYVPPTKVDPELKVGANVFPGETIRAMQGAGTMAETLKPVKGVNPIPVNNKELKPGVVTYKGKWYVVDKSSGKLLAHEIEDPIIKPQQ